MCPLCAVKALSCSHAHMDCCRLPTCSVEAGERCDGVYAPIGTCILQAAVPAVPCLSLEHHTHAHSGQLHACSSMHARVTKLRPAFGVMRGDLRESHRCVSTAKLTSDYHLRNHHAGGYPATQPPSVQTQLETKSLPPTCKHFTGKTREEWNGMRCGSTARLPCCPTMWENPRKLWIINRALLSLSQCT